jgi:hypothetical protein
MLKCKSFLYKIEGESFVLLAMTTDKPAKNPATSNEGDTVELPSLNIDVSPGTIVPSGNDSKIIETELEELKELVERKKELELKNEIVPDGLTKEIDSQFEKIERAIESINYEIYKSKDIVFQQTKEIRGLQLDLKSLQNNNKSLESKKEPTSFYSRSLLYNFVNTMGLALGVAFVLAGLNCPYIERVEVLDNSNLKPGIENQIRRPVVEREHYINQSKDIIWGGFIIIALCLGVAAEQISPGIFRTLMETIQNQSNSKKDAREKEVEKDEEDRKDNLVNY